MTIDREEKVQGAKHYYKKGEYAGLAFLLAEKHSMPIIDYLDTNPRKPVSEIAKALKAPVTDVMFLAADLATVGLLKRDMIEITPPRGTEMGHAVVHYSLADNFGDLFNDIVLTAASSRDRALKRMGGGQHLDPKLGKSLRTEAHRFLALHLQELGVQRRMAAEAP